LILRAMLAAYPDGMATRSSPDPLTLALLPRPALERFAEHAVLMAGYALPQAQELFDAVRGVVAAAPWRHMVTPGGLTMSVAMSNCGQVGWVSDRHGYRYTDTDPDSARHWPVMPAAMKTLAMRAAEAAGFGGFEPDACLMNHYQPGNRLTLHQDRNERDFAAPVVSVSLGLPAVFLFGGLKRSDPTRRIPLLHGDVVVWGGSQRLAFHGVAKLAQGDHLLTGRCRINLTFRQAL
jgi:alkylated DNA repair protein (DNA oxidative demethylase)